MLKYKAIAYHCHNRLSSTILDEMAAANPSSSIMNACHVALNLPEILEHILGFVADPLDEAEREFLFRNRVILGGRDSPWTFLLVCKYWRTVALSTPQVWSAFHLELYECRYTKVARLPTFVDAFLQRSKNAPLTLTILLPFESQIYDPAEFDASVPVRTVLQKAMECQERWKDVVLGMRVPEWAFHPPVDFTIRLGDMKILNRLVILNSLDWDVDGERRMDLGPCPQLETIKVTGSWKSSIAARVNSSRRDQIISPSTVYLWDLGCIDCWKLLQFTSHVEHLVLKPIYERPLPMPLLELPKLQSMHLHHGGRNYDVDPIQNPQAPVSSIFDNVEDREEIVIQRRLYRSFAGYTAFPPNSFGIKIRRAGA